MLAGPQLFSSKWLMRETFTSTNLNKIQPLLYENECPLSIVVYFCDQELAALWSWTTLLCMSFIPLIIQSLDYSVVVVLSQNLCLFRLPHKHIIYIIISPFGKSIKTPFFFHWYSAIWYSNTVVGLSSWNIWLQLGKERSPLAEFLELTEFFKVKLVQCLREFNATNF